jgi:hypothetical protein
MKIVDYDTFVKMPQGTIYSTYSPCNFGDIYCLEEVINDGSDWFLSRMINNPDDNCDIQKCCTDMENGVSIDADFHCWERDGMFDYDRKFLVYETKDIEMFIEKLQDCLNKIK